MTTIAYRAPFMVSDGRVTQDNIIVTDRCQKIFELTNGGLMGFAGAFDSRPIAELFDRVKTTKAFPTPAQIIAERVDFRAILAMADGSVWMVEAGPDYTDEDGEKNKDEWSAAIYPIHDPYIAVGSGSRWAKAAMDMGAQAEKAVRIALKNDSRSGGKIQKFELRPKRTRSRK